MDMLRRRGPWDTEQTLRRYEERDLSRKCRLGGHQGKGGNRPWEQLRQPSEHGANLEEGPAELQMGGETLRPDWEGTANKMGGNQEREVPGQEEKVFPGRGHGRQCQMLPRGQAR